MAVMRELKRLEANNCRRSVDELQMSDELTQMRLELEQMRLQHDVAAAAASTNATCIVCFDDAIPAERGVFCREVDGHFLSDVKKKNSSDLGV
eukprot:7069943-Prymnesium_polylepis.1